jgi:hypothetical protein
MTRLVAIGLINDRTILGISVGSSTHCDPSALFILGVHTVRICDIELHTVRVIINRTGSISSTVCQYISTHGVHRDTLPRSPTKIVLKVS